MEGKGKVWFLLSIAVLTILGLWLYINRFLYKTGAVASRVNVTFAPKTGTFPKNEEKKTTVLFSPRDSDRKLSGVDATFKAEGVAELISARLVDGVPTNFTDDPIINRLSSDKKTLRFSVISTKENSQLPANATIEVTFKGTTDGTGKVKLDTATSELAGPGSGLSFGNVEEGNYTFGEGGGGGDDEDGTEPPPVCEPEGPPGAEKTVNINVKVEGTGGGWVTDDECYVRCTKRGGKCQKKIRPGGEYELKATPNNSSEFDKWTPKSSCNNNKSQTCKKTNVRSDTTVTAVFKNKGGGGPTNTPTPTPEGPTNTPTPTPEGPTATPTPTGTIVCGTQGATCDSTIIPGPWSPCCSGLACRPIQEGAELSTCQQEGPSGAVTLDLKLRFQGIVDRPQRSDTMRVKVTLIGRGGVRPLAGGEEEQEESAPAVLSIPPQEKTAELTVDDKGIWSGSVTFDFVRRGGGYALLVKGEQHMQKRICELSPKETAPGTYRCSEGRITFSQGQTTANLSAITLLVGDLPPQNGVVDAYDIAYIRQNLRSTDSKVLSIADLNRDGIVDTQDYSLLIASLSVKYDEE